MGGSKKSQAVDDSSPVIRQRLLEQPELFLKARRQAEPQEPSTPAAELLRDLDMVVAITKRASRRARHVALEMDRRQCDQARRQIEGALDQLSQLARAIPREEEHVEQRPADGDSRTRGSGGEPPRDRPGHGNLPPDSAQSRWIEVLRSALQRPEKAEPYRQEIMELLKKCKGNLVRVHEELAAGGAAMSYQSLTAFCRRHGIGQAPVVAAGRYHFEPGE